MNSKETLIRIFLLALLIYSLISFASVKRAAEKADIEMASLCEKLSALEADNARMRESLEEGLSDAELEQLARHRLGLVMPGEKIFYFITDRED